MNSCRVAVVHVLAESTFHPIISFAVPDVIQPVRVELEATVAPDKVGLSEAVILLDAVGMLVCFHTSNTIDPDGDPKMLHEFIVKLYGIIMYPFCPIVITPPCPSRDRPI